MMRLRSGIIVAALLVATLFLSPSALAADVKIGSKVFTESVILGEVATRLARSAGAEARHRRQLGGTRVLWSAIARADIDVYPEYTGTLRQEIFKDRDVGTDAALEAELAAYGIAMTPPLGFNNTYAIGMLENRAAALGIETISDLRRHPALILGFGNEFMDRGDGWPALRARYNLPHRNVRGLDHDLAYRGLDSGDIDVMDLYATDAEIDYYDIRVLRDDLGHFPDYEAVYLYRAALAETAPDVPAALARLGGTIDDETMRRLNRAVKIEGASEGDIARQFLETTLGLPTGGGLGPGAGIVQRLWRNTLEHLALVAVSLSAAIAVGIPLGIAAWWWPRLGQFILGGTGIIQTIPALALLVFMIPLFGIGGLPAMVALFLYSLLPIVRNTYTGLDGIAEPVRRSALALGLGIWDRMTRIELPLATPTILAGIKTSAVINVGTATLGALIGAGGYGQPILTGIRLDDTGLILEGAIPAALLALGVQYLFSGLETLVVPHRRYRTGR